MNKNKLNSLTKKSFRRPDKLPKLRKLPQIGDLVALQDLDGEVFLCIVLEIEFNKTKKGKETKVLKAIHILSGNRIAQVRLSDLSSIQTYTQR